MKTFTTAAGALLLLANQAQATVYTNESDPYYGQSPPVYPTPEGTGGLDTAWQSAYTKAKSLVTQMTLIEKVNMTRGHTGVCVGNTPKVERLGIKALCFADSPSGIRGQEFVSSFPAQIHVGATFDKELMHSYGKALGEEYRGKGINIALLPVGGPLGRVARGGRNWEGFGADQFLSSVGMGAVTTGLQGTGVIAQMKHWLLNEQEWRRNPGVGVTDGEAISSNADDRTIHELYAFPFMDALKAGAASAMCSYQRVNNSYSCQNSKLLNGILKTELGFQGFVTSDWQAQHAGTDWKARGIQGVATANAGLDLVMPDGGYWGDNLTAAVTNGSVSETRLNDMVTRILAAWYLLGQDDGFPDPTVHNFDVQSPIIDVRGDHGKLIREIGAAGTVLVKNVNGTLPFDKPRFLNIYGYDAKAADDPWTTPARFGGGYDVNFGWNTFNGTMVTAGGSGSNTPSYLISPFDAIQRRVIDDHGMVRWDFASVDPTVYVNAEASLVFINAYASESFDRTTLTDAFSDELVKNVAAQHSNTIVVIHSAGIRVVDEWIDHPNITAVLFAGLPGQESGNSLVDVLYGDVSPSGRLPYTVAKNESDYGNLLNTTLGSGAYPQDNFTEGLYIDYRHFDKYNITPRFEFGYGLGYSTFLYSPNLTVVATSDKTSEYPATNITTIPQGGHPDLWDVLFNITVTVTNTGNVTAAEVPQLYVTVPNAPEWQLRGFGKVNLASGASGNVTFELTRRDLSIWDVVAQKWKLQAAKYPLFVGASSRDVKLTGEFVV